MGYRSPTIIERYCEFKLAKGGLSHGQMIHAANALVGSGLPIIEIDQVMILNTPPEMPRPSQRIRAWNSERTEVAQFTSNNIQINFLTADPKKYIKWSALKVILGRYFSVIQSACPGVHVIGVSYFDRDKFQCDLNGFSIGKYLNCSSGVIPKWYQDSKEAIDIHHGLGVLEVDGFNRQLRVVGRPTGEKYEISLDFVNSRRANEISIDQFDVLHEDMNSRFNEVITQHTKDTILGGEE